MLSAQALHHLRKVMHAAAELHAAIRPAPAIHPAPDDLLAVPALLAELDRTISPAGRLNSDSLPELAELHESFRAAHRSLDIRLKRMADDMNEREDETPPAAEVGVSWQNHRGMLALPGDGIDAVAGVRRGTEPGTRRLLLEPMEAVADNNRLEAIQGRIEAREREILRDLSARAHQARASLDRMVAALTWIDLAIAGGRLSAAMNASPPRLVDTPQIHLDRAYHPYLMMQFRDGQLPRLVPLSLDMDDPGALFVITGPNTGGKTVALKTLGLLVVMARCGLHLPSEGPCVVGHFARILVDVGDRQSLQHQLSTFAAHVEMLKRVLQEADAATLVLLDELGTGTDPHEGAALAMAVLDELAARNVCGMVTTHLPEIRRFAAGHPQLKNACMRFDRDSLSPTFELQLGASGQSLGLLIAEQRGLPAALVERARAYLAPPAAAIPS
jgi:DNA mismatch repair protein MutS2